MQAGETLSQIAKRYGTTVAALMAANDLPSADKISVGQRLIISKGGGSAPVTAVKPTKFVVSISQQRCWLYAGETLIAKWVCSTGRRSSATRPRHLPHPVKAAQSLGFAVGLLDALLARYLLGGGE